MKLHICQVRMNFDVFPAFRGALTAMKVERLSLLLFFQGQDWDFRDIVGDVSAFIIYYHLHLFYTTFP